MTQSKTKPALIRVNVAIFVGLPLAALLLVPAWGIYRGFDTFQWLWALAFLYLNGMSITGGYHRLWAHKAYEASPLLKWFYAFWGAGALQNSILIWASDHRRHHRHVDDNDLDPYSAGRGLWFSHMGWMLREYRSNETDLTNARDLQRDPVVMWQHRHYVPLTLLMNLGLPLLLGIWHGDIIGTLLLVGLLRRACLLRLLGERRPGAVGVPLPGVAVPGEQLLGAADAAEREPAALRPGGVRSPRTASRACWLRPRPLAVQRSRSSTCPREWGCA